MENFRFDDFKRKKVLISLKNDDFVFGEIVEEVGEKILIDKKTGSMREVNLREVEKIITKFNFIHPKRVYEINRDSKGNLTKKIEMLMSIEGEWELVTRKHHLTKNGALKKRKVNPCEVEIKFLEKAELKTNKMSSICAFAYFYNITTKEELFIYGRANGEIILTSDNEI